MLDDSRTEAHWYLGNAYTSLVGWEPLLDGKGTVRAWAIQFWGQGEWSEAFAAVQ